MSPNKVRFGPLVLAGLALTVTTGLAQALLYPDTVYVNGIIITMNASNETAQAFAVKGDTIVAVGTDSEIRKLAGPATRVVDLNNKVVTPGFYAAHDHLVLQAEVTRYQARLESPPMGTMKNVADVIQALQKQAQRTPKGQWVRGWGYDDTLLAEKRHLTRYDLDQVSTELPIYISHTSGHLGVANSKALELARVTKDTAAPTGGVIRKDPKTGEPTGVLEETAQGKVRSLIAPYTTAQTVEAIKSIVPDYVEEGVTTVSITGGDRLSIAGLQKASAEGMLPIRVITMGSKSAGVLSPGEAGGFVTGFGNNMLRLGGIKIVQDGSIQGYTGYLSKPYHVPFKPSEQRAADPSYRAYPYRTREELATLVKEAHRAGYQIGIHGNGDAGIDDIIYAFREAQKEFPRPDARHRIEHCQTAREDQLDAIKELGITPSFFVGHVYYWGDRHRDIFLGPERGSRISPLKSALNRGIRFTIHDDTPVTPVRPLQLVWVSATRLTSSGQVLGPEQRISPLEALRAVTSDAAWQNFNENINGSIEPGKLADFVVLAENPLTVDAVKIKDIQVLQTVIGGKTAYSR